MPRRLIGKAAPRASSGRNKNSKNTTTITADATDLEVDDALMTGQDISIIFHSDNVAEITSREQYDGIAADRVPSAIWFYSTWSRPCAQLAPFYNTLATKRTSTVNFYRVNVDRYLKLNGYVTNTPTILFFSGGRQVGRVVGPDLHKIVEKLTLLCSIG